MPAGQCAERARHDVGPVQRTAWSLTRAGPSLGEAPEPPSRPHRLAEGGEVDDPDGDAVLVLEREQVRVERHPAGERLRAVDRVEDPSAAAGARGGGLLLAEHAVAGERLRELLPQEALGVAIGGRDRCAVALALHLEVGRRGTTAGCAPRPLAAASRPDRGRRTSREVPPGESAIGGASGTVAAMCMNCVSHTEVVVGQAALAAAVLKDPVHRRARLGGRRRSVRSGEA